MSETARGVSVLGIWNWQRLFASSHLARKSKAIVSCAQSYPWKTCFSKRHPCIRCSTVKSGFNIDPSQGCCVKKLMIGVKNNHYRQNTRNTVCFLDKESWLIISLKWNKEKFPSETYNLSFMSPVKPYGYNSITAILHCGLFKNVGRRIFAWWRGELRWNDKVKFQAVCWFLVKDTALWLCSVYLHVRQVTAPGNTFLSRH